VRTRAFIAIAALATVGAAAPTAQAQQSDDRCLTADPPAITRPAEPLRFGIAPRAAGSVGAAQSAVVPEDEGRALAALQDLRPPGAPFVMRLNRLFWADGAEGLERFGALADRYAAAGFQVESQVRYHPPEGKEGDIAAWEQYVRAAVRELGSRRAVVELSITNEGNLPASGNTSDGGYDGIHDAIVRGVIAARREADAIGRPDLRIGFSVMWRWSPDSDAKFWQRIGELADANPAFRPSLDHVGLQIYPGLVWPPAPLPDRTAGDEVVEALTLLRHCYMPKAKLGPDVAAWISENGYATNLGRTEQTQVTDLQTTLDAVHKWSGELGVTDYRYFNLRDNDSDGPDLFSAVGLLRDDYTRKPAFATFGGLIARMGAPPRSGPGGSPAHGGTLRPARPRPPPRAPHLPRHRPRARQAVRRPRPRQHRAPCPQRPRPRRLPVPRPDPRAPQGGPPRHAGRPPRPVDRPPAPRAAVLDVQAGRASRAAGVRSLATRALGAHRGARRDTAPRHAGGDDRRALRLDDAQHQAHALGGEPRAGADVARRPADAALVAQHLGP
jgi:hypothetical protein